MSEENQTTTETNGNVVGDDLLLMMEGAGENHSLEDITTNGAVARLNAAVESRGSLVPKNSTPPRAAKEKPTNDTESSRKKKLEMNRIRSSSVRSHETSEQREARLLANRVRVAGIRAKETPEQRSARLLKNRIRIAEMRKRETPEQRKARLLSNRLRSSAIRSKKFYDANNATASGPASSKKKKTTTYAVPSTEDDTAPVVDV